MRGDVSVPHSLCDLIGRADAVARGKAAGDVGAHLPIHRNMRTVQTQARQQRGRGDGAAQAEQTVHRDLGTVPEGNGGDLLLPFDLPDRSGKALDVFSLHLAVGIGREQIQLFRDLGEIFHLVLVAFGAAEHGDRLSPVKHPVAGGAVADAAAEQLRLTGQALGRDDAGAEDQGFRLEDLVVRQKHEGVLHPGDVRHHPVGDLQAEHLRVLPELFV